MLILNDDSDPIDGTLSGFAEGSLIPLDAQRSLRVTYLANGDGGPIGNDFGLTVVTSTFGSDLAVTAVAPAAVALGAEFAVQYTVNNLGPGAVSDGVLKVTKPATAAFTGPLPPGAVINANEMSIPLTVLAAPGNTGVEVRFTAPAGTTAVAIAAAVSSGTADPIPANNSYTTTTAALVGGKPAISAVSVDHANDTMTLGITTLSGVSYVFQRSLNLVDWENLLNFTGNGLPFQRAEAIDETKEFFRIGIVPSGGHP